MMTTVRVATAIACIMCAAAIAQERRPPARASIEDVAGLAGDCTGADGALKH